MTKPRILLVLLIASALSAHATIRFVSPSGTAPYQTVAAAIAASVNGDTILIGPGTYNEGLSFPGLRTVIGAGWDQTTLSGGGLNLNTGGLAGSVVEGISMVFSAPVFGLGQVDSILIRRCRFQSTGNVSGTLNSNSTRVTFEDCLFVQSAAYGFVNISIGRTVFRNCLFVHYNGNSNTRYAFSGSNGNLEIYNCVFLGLLRILNCTGAQPVVFINNVAYDWAGASPSYGTYLAGSMFAYNASDVITPPGDSALVLTADPFVNYDEAANYVDGTSDLHPAPGSPLIDSGHPDITDLDSTRSDRGSYGGPRPFVSFGVPSFPFALTLTATPTLIGVGDTVQVNSSGRVGPRY